MGFYVTALAKTIYLTIRLPVLSAKISIDFLFSKVWHTLPNSNSTESLEIQITWVSPPPNYFLHHSL